MGQFSEKEDLVSLKVEGEKIIERLWTLRDMWGGSGEGWKMPELSDKNLYYVKLFWSVKEGGVAWHFI